MSGLDTPLKYMVGLVTARVERAILVRTLALSQGNKAKAARTLKIDNKTLHGKLKMYEISALQILNEEAGRR